MNDNECSSATIIAEDMNKQILNLKITVAKFMADFMLKIPIGIPYEVWKKLHLIKGDYE
jgi:hypothetical protein